MKKSVLVATAQLNIFNNNALNYNLLKKIAAAGIDIRVITTMNKTTDTYILEKLSVETQLNIKMNDKEISGLVKSGKWDGIELYLIDAPIYFEREDIYNQKDEAEIFSYFCKAVLESLPLINFKPDIIHCEDWPTAFIPFILKDKYKRNKFYESIKTVYTFNNLGYQGVFDKENCAYLDIEWDRLLFTGLDYYEQINYMKAGLMFADRLTTVSSNYLKEIVTDMYGATLEKIISNRYEDICGILTGINQDIDNPETDKRVYINYNVNNHQVKLENKKILQELLKLPVGGDIPLIFYNSSLSAEKGADLVQYFLPDIMKSKVQMVIMAPKVKGNDFEEEIYEQFFLNAVEQYSEQLCYLSYDEELVYKCFSAADIYLMPSAIEPCGYGQLVAMRYGAVPVVRQVGGLVDTIRSFDEEPSSATGFCFQYSNEKVLLYTVRKALHAYKNKELWNKIVKNCMLQDFGIGKYADKYIELYDDMINKNYSITRYGCRRCSL